MSKSLHGRAKSFRFILLAGFAFFPILEVASLRGQDSQLGSTGTLEQLQRGFRDQPSAQMVPNVPREVDLVTEPATTSRLRLQYRFWPDDLSLKPGMAIVHLDRALIFYQQLGKPALQDWNDYQVALDDANPDPADLRKRLEMFGNVYQELSRFAECEDLSWDLRLRDLRGVDVYGFLLPEVQQYRELARLLRFRALEQLGRGDFDGAIATIRCGYRLAAFVRQGETLIQQLVGIAIEGIMQGVVEDAIRTPGCPNLYFALATVPHERRPMFRALEFEISSFKRVFPLLNEPETQTWSREVWAQKWSEAADSLSQLSGMGMGSEDSRGKALLSLVLAAEVASDARTARKQLVEAGLNPDKVAAMFPEQALAIDTSLQLRKWGEELLASFLLPTPAAQSAAQAVESRMNLGFDLPTSRNIGLVFGGLLLPAVNAAIQAELRVQSTHHRLLTIEAIRHYAATHDGKLPQSLAELTELPPQIDLHTGELIGYEVKSGPEGEWAELSIETKTLPEEMTIRRMKFRR